MNIKWSTRKFNKAFDRGDKCMKIHSLLAYVNCLLNIFKFDVDFIENINNHYIPFTYK